ncbi:hypothetical protein SDRG_02046 [Saprolegnia diclina VS20]|uniref:DNA-directed RNA polymerase I subunit RPA49 n=1 Tax=Saprolegnia diclina (strain VS20) TaxID=1156394 RepID=T0QS91_SAPDV|nr:hypothetical protein SDRG_02046 [Saprolegnia diclina VS20]EQC40984.1 hypothetical protein SDRG_02046 [Saprolegnia diclina VS20]|eukprot:XP_008605828.1 hypothetical protein SDRG_02046 [Saprolegnia diclina VS20]
MSKRSVELSFDAKQADSAPVLVSFRGGPPKVSSDFHFQMYENAAKKRKIVVADADKVSYQAANFGHGNANNDLSSYVVGVFDKATQSVQLYNVDQLYVLQQSVRGFRERVDENTQDDKSYAQRTAELVNAFGSKVSKRIVKSREDNKVQVGNITGASAITQALTQKAVSTAEELALKRANDPKYTPDSGAMDATRAAVLPPCNLDAVTPDKVYDLEKFLNADVMESLYLKADELIGLLETCPLTEFLDKNQVPAAAYIRQVMTTLPKPFDRKKVALMLYVMYLVQFFHARFPMHATPADLSVTLNIPHVVIEQVLSTFAETVVGSNGKASYAQSKMLKDKLLLYLLVVALTIGGFSLDLTAIAADLKRAPSNLAQYARMIGCRTDAVKAEGGLYAKSSAVKDKKTMATRAVLSVPLVFPTAKKGSSRR